MFKKFLLLFLLLMFNVSFATMFAPLPFDKQVEEATSGAEVKLTSSRVFKNESGLIMTEYSFDVLESHNVDSDDLENQKLKLTMPGGTYNGMTSMIDGAPQFAMEEKSFLLLKKIENKIYLSNFSLGKFKIQEFEGKTYYVSEVFPMDPKIGRISKDKMLDLMKTKWKTSYVPLNFPKMENVKEAEQEFARVPPAPISAGIEKREPAQEMVPSFGVPYFFWTSLFMVGFFFALIFKKLSQSEHQHKRE